MKTAVQELIQLLDLERIEVNLFRGNSPNEGWQRVFGGQVIGQALIAAYRTVEERVAHSLHAYFLRPGDPKLPILYEVERVRDGKSFTTRRVVAIQHGEVIFIMSVSFQIEEQGFEHQITMPDVPGPEDLPSERDLRLQHIDRIPKAFQAHFLRERPIEVRPVNGVESFTKARPREPVNRVWFRAGDTLPDDFTLHQVALAYASDLTLLDTSSFPHGVFLWSEKLQSASLDHAMWFHRRFRMDEWLLYDQDSPCAAGARGFNRGSVYTRDGVLVASVAQEGLIRLRS